MVFELEVRRDLANLTRHFRARYGMTMREWRLKKKSD